MKTTKVIVSRIGIIVGCVGILLFVAVYSAVILYFFGSTYTRIGFYLPVLSVVLFIYLRRKNRGFFLESLAFIFSLFLTMIVTSDLLGIL